MNDRTSGNDGVREDAGNVTGGREEMSHSLARRACIGSESDYEPVPAQSVRRMRVRFRYVGRGQPLPLHFDDNLMRQTET